MALTPFQDEKSSTTKWMSVRFLHILSECKKIHSHDILIGFRHFLKLAKNSDEILFEKMNALFKILDYSHLVLLVLSNFKTNEPIDRWKTDNTQLSFYSSILHSTNQIFLFFFWKFFTLSSTKIQHLSVYKQTNEREKMLAQCLH